MNESFPHSNKRTVESYDHHWGQYEIDQSYSLPPFYSDWLNKTVEGLDGSAKIFDFGSGAGHEAFYLQGLGYSVTCSDASSSAVELLRRRGLAAEKIDVLVDELPAECQLVLASGVVAHFNPDELQLVCDKVFAALSGAGRFAFSAVEGRVQGWYRGSQGRIRYLSHLPQAEIEALLGRSGFEEIKVAKEKIRGRAGILDIIAHKAA